MTHTTYTHNVRAISSAVVVGDPLTVINNTGEVVQMLKRSAKRYSEKHNRQQVVAEAKRIMQAAVEKQLSAPVQKPTVVDVEVRKPIPGTVLQAEVAFDPFDMEGHAVWGWVHTTYGVFPIFNEVDQLDIWERAIHHTDMQFSSLYDEDTGTVWYYIKMTAMGRQQLFNKLKAVYIQRKADENKQLYTVPTNYSEHINKANRARACMRNNYKWPGAVPTIERDPYAHEPVEMRPAELPTKGVFVFRGTKLYAGQVYSAKSQWSPKESDYLWLMGQVRKGFAGFEMEIHKSGNVKIEIHRMSPALVPMPELGYGPAEEEIVRQLEILDNPCPPKRFKVDRFDLREVQVDWAGGSKMGTWVAGL